MVFLEASSHVSTRGIPSMYQKECNAVARCDEPNIPPLPQKMFHDDWANMVGMTDFQIWKNVFRISTRWCH